MPHSSIFGIFDRYSASRFERTDDSGTGNVGRNADREARAAVKSAVKSSQVLVEIVARPSGDLIDLVYYQEKAIAEVAKIIGTPENTVKTRMCYARKRLAELLKGAGLDRA